MSDEMDLAWATSPDASAGSFDYAYAELCCRLCETARLSAVGPVSAECRDCTHHRACGSQQCHASLLRARRASHVAMVHSDCRGIEGIRNKRSPDNRRFFPQHPATRRRPQLGHANRFAIGAAGLICDVHSSPRSAST